MGFWDQPSAMDRDTTAGWHSLDRVRLTQSREVGPATRLESGHAISWYLAHSARGRPLRDPAEWAMKIWHPGDPTGRYIESHLGDSDHELGQRSLAELRHRDVVREMGEQWKRARAAGDPHGIQASTTATWVPMGNGPSHVFRHYE